MKKCLGIEIGTRKIRFGLCDGGELLSAWEETLPPGYAEEGAVLEWDRMGRFLEKKAESARWNCRRAAVVLPDKLVYTTRLRLPDMRPGQILLNLPFEFPELPGKKEDYLMDYELLGRVEEKEGEPYLELLAAAADRKLLDHYRELTRRMGMNLVLALPQAVIVQRLIESAGKGKAEPLPRDFALLYLGEEEGRLCMFSNGRYETGKVLDTGTGEDIRREEGDRISLEIMRALNFFQYTYPQSSVETIYFWGKKADAHRCRAIEANAGATVFPASRLFSGKPSNPFLWEGTAAALAWEERGGI